MLLDPGIEIKAIEGFALDADRNQRQPGPDLLIEAVLVHAEIPRRIPEPQQTGEEAGASQDARRAQAPISGLFVESFRRRGQVLTHHPIIAQTRQKVGRGLSPLCAETPRGSEHLCRSFWVKSTETRKKVSRFLLKLDRNLD